MTRAEEVGLVAREPSTVDRRVTLVRLTAEGERRLEATVAQLREDRQRLVEVISALADEDAGGG